MELRPPPLFKQGASARARVWASATLAVALLVVDARYSTLVWVRHAVSVVLHPFELAVRLPVRWMSESGEFLSKQEDLKSSNEALRQQRLLDAEMLQKLALLETENQHLRELDEHRQATRVGSVLAEIIYEGRDPYVRRVTLDRGLNHGLEPGQPVMNEHGVLGQVTRAFPLSAEVTLLTDRNQAIPVMVARNGLRSVAYGGQDPGTLELRYLAANAEVEEGDQLVTSGIDGLYPAGLAVATVKRRISEPGTMFARIVCEPAAQIDRHRHVLVLKVSNNLPPPPPADDAPEKRSKGRK